MLHPTDELQWLSQAARTNARKKYCYCLRVNSVSPFAANSFCVLKNDQNGADVISDALRNRIEMAIVITITNVCLSDCQLKLTDNS
jgi:hypothetical protein